ncbi:Na/Pi cotransporter family protein [Arenibacter troitsensis]|uniref:Phosphate:Na+ symporter n=1 Tax=Arenibacter troitsensis TaxID=188872 RepID=A0A1X7IR63_9FLAO|nr:Na/Pi symporter [Arenibacter troitsensis]SMG17323.1 phosphate:Na+ symporter [Arenibacter troitsensis]
MKKILLFSSLILLGMLLFMNPTVKEIAAGIAILLFGMIMLEEGFHSFASGPLQVLLKKSTDKLYKSIGLGFLSAAILQSSSLISVILISFISAGLIGLRAGIGIIFGSNIGTTATTWLVSTLGLKIDIAGLAMPMLAFGIVLVLQKPKKLKGIGQILAGLGFFFMGIFFMKNGFDVYKDNINLADFAIPGVLDLVIYTFIGVLITMILQSSSATMALILTALAVGQITYTNSLALSIGANVGTTITAIIGSLGSNISGKRLAGAHFIFNIVTGLIALVFIGYLGQLVDIISGWVGISQSNYTFKLSVFHSIFNVLGVIIMIPLINPLINILNRVFKSSDEEDIIEQPQFLDENALAYPQTALLALRNETKRLFEKAAFTIIPHGMNIHRTDLFGEEKIKEVVKKSRKEIEVNIEELYLRKIKTIYGKIIEFTTLAQSRSSVSPELTKQFAQIKLASRDIVEAIKALEEIRKNMNVHLFSENMHIRHEYDLLRQKISKILRALYLLQKSPEPTLHLKKLKKLKSDTEKSDILLDGTLDQLIREGKIPSTVVSSLVNDSHIVALISKKLIEAGELIYINQDTMDLTETNP